MATRSDTTAVTAVLVTPAPRWRGLAADVRRSRGAVAGLVLVAVLLIVAIFPNQITPIDPNEQNLMDRLRPPIGVPPSPMQATVPPRYAYLLGTDHLGRDIFSRVVHGARTSLTIALLAIVLAAAIGITIGLVAGYRGGLVDDALMRLVDLQLAFPYILLAIAVIGVLGPSVVNVVVVLAIANWVAFARIVRAETLAARELQYVEAARALGASSRRILFRHILPNVTASIIVVATFGVANIVVAEAGLSFLGMGVPPSIPSWGGMLADGRLFVDTAWWLALFPGLAIVVTVLGINLLGDFLRDLLDPYLHASRTIEQ